MVEILLYFLTHRNQRMSLEGNRDNTHLKTCPVTYTLQMDVTPRISRPSQTCATYIETKRSNHEPLGDISHSGYHGMFVVCFFNQQLPSCFSQWVPMFHPYPTQWDLSYLYHHQHLVWTVLLWFANPVTIIILMHMMSPSLCLSLHLEAWLWASFPMIICPYFLVKSLFKSLSVRVPIWLLFSPYPPVLAVSKSWHSTTPLSPSVQLVLISKSIESRVIRNDLAWS